MHVDRNPVWKRFRTGLLVLLVLSAASIARADKPFFFIQLTDPQFGFVAQNENFEKETENFELAIATANRLKPAFVIVTGDLTHKTNDDAQVKEYLRIVGKLDRSIAFYQLPGNHDVGNKPTPESIAAYVKRFGRDRYTFRHGNLLGIAVNSNLLMAPEAVEQQASEQDAWLRGELAKARAEKVRHVVVFQHHPVFVKTPDEPDAYFNLPLERRMSYLELLKQNGVRHVFAGHYHADRVLRDGATEFIITGAVGKPLHKSQSGLRVVAVRDSGIEHKFYELTALPAKVDPSLPKLPD